ncbi:unnamed protein product [Paramecium pentaurelia]|uniref:Uncharacterized protein n=1 Tax=Paramecium pentaurelia TaxID=43138 RepID=A0A8S1VFP1_9CILI|nr:unnamed protein product [Paramecium pentaurelia]
MHNQTYFKKQRKHSLPFENQSPTIRWSYQYCLLTSGSSDKSIRLWDVKTGQQKDKLDDHTNAVYSVCFSPDENKLASGSSDKSIYIWDVKQGQKIQSTDKHYKDLLKQFQIPLQQHNHIFEASNYMTTLLISKKAMFQVKGALILKGQFMNQSGFDLKTLFKQKGSFILEDFKQQ